MLIPTNGRKKNDTLHAQLCEDCQYELTANHIWGAWIDSENGQTHTRACTDGCGATQSADHTWGSWTDSGDGQTHTRACTYGCGATQSAPHSWNTWYETEGETLTRECGDCTAWEIKPDERHVSAALFENGGYTPYYTLQSAFDAAQPGQTVYFIYEPDGIELEETLLIGKSVLLGAAVRTVGEDCRASYAVSEAPILLKRAVGFAGTMIRIARNAEILFEHLMIEGGEADSPAVENYGALTVTGGTIEAVCAIYVRTAVTRALFALGGNAALSVSGSPVLGKIRLDDPLGGEVPFVDLEGFEGELTLVIGDGRSYGVFADHIGQNASVFVEGGARWQEGLSAREVRLQDGKYLCGGYDLQVAQTALGEVIFTGSCDEYLTSLTITVNGTPVTLSSQDGTFGAAALNTGAANEIDIEIGGASSSLGLVYFDETTGRITAPENASYTKNGQTFPLAGADPFALGLDGDEGTVTVGGAMRTLDFSRPVGIAFVHDYLTAESGAVFGKIDYTNYERVQRAMAVYESMTVNQRAAADERLAASSSFSSFESMVTAMQTYLEEQIRLAEEFIGENNALSKDFEDLGAGDGALLSDALDGYRASSDDEKYFLDRQAADQGYEDFEDMVDDMFAKTDFEETREETLGDLETMLRGCDGKRVRDELNLKIETVKVAEYERCLESDYRLQRLAEQKASLEVAVRVLENIRIEEREKSALEEYVKEKRESGRYSAEALDRLEAIAASVGALLGEVDPESEDGAAQLERLYEEGVSMLDGVRSHTVSTYGLDPSALHAYEGEGLIGYLTREEGFRGNSELYIRFGEGAQVKERDLVCLFGVTVSLTGDSLQGGIKVVLLLPEEARGYTGYRVRMTLGGAEKTFAASVEDDILTFEFRADAASVLLAEVTDGEYGSFSFSVLADKIIDLQWLIILLGALCALETLALGYVLVYFAGGKARTAAFAPVLLSAVIIPGPAAEICIALGAVCLAEALALVLLIRQVLCRERERDKEEERQGG